MLCTPAGATLDRNATRGVARNACTAHLGAGLLEPLEIAVLVRQEVAYRRLTAREVVDVDYTTPCVALGRRLAGLVAPAGACGDAAVSTHNRPVASASSAVAHLDRSTHRSRLAPRPGTCRGSKIAGEFARVSFRTGRS